MLKISPDASASQFTILQALAANQMLAYRANPQNTAIPSDQLARQAVTDALTLVSVFNAIVDESEVPNV